MYARENPLDFELRHLLTRCRYRTGTRDYAVLASGSEFLVRLAAKARERPFGTTDPGFWTNDEEVGRSILNSKSSAEAPVTPCPAAPFQPFRGCRVVGNCRMGLERNI